MQSVLRSSKMHLIRIYMSGCRFTDCAWILIWFRMKQRLYKLRFTLMMDTVMFIFYLFFHCTRPGVTLDSSLTFAENTSNMTRSYLSDPPDNPSRPQSLPPVFTHLAYMVLLYITVLFKKRAWDLQIPLSGIIYIQIDNMHIEARDPEWVALGMNVVYGACFPWIQRYNPVAVGGLPSTLFLVIQKTNIKKLLIKFWVLQNV